MIIGGVGGVCRVGSFKIGCKHYFLPIILNSGEVSETITTAPARFSASARIKNSSDVWVDLADATYCQISSNSKAGSSAFLTIKNTVKWSIDGISNEDLLRPSQRIVQINCTMAVAGQVFSALVFSGQIQNYSEAQGQSGGSISLSLKGGGQLLANRPATLTRYKTVYRRIEAELAASGLFFQGQTPLFLLEDSVIAAFSEYSSILTMLTQLAGSLSEVITRASGGIILGKQSDSIETTAKFLISDNSSSALTRSVGSAGSYNTAACIGLSGGSVVQRLIQNTADVSSRGVVQYPSVIGDTSTAIEESEAEAELMISESLRGKISTQIRLNPFINTGSILGFSSARLFIASVNARANSCNHQYSNGQCVTTLSGLAVLE